MVNNLDLTADKKVKMVNTVVNLDCSVVHLDCISESLACIEEILDCSLVIPGCISDLLEYTLEKKANSLDLMENNLGW